MVLQRVAVCHSGGEVPIGWHRLEITAAWSICYWTSDGGSESASRRPIVEVRVEDPQQPQSLEAASGWEDAEYLCPDSLSTPANSTEEFVVIEHPPSPNTQPKDGVISRTPSQAPPAALRIRRLPVANASDAGAGAAACGTATPADAAVQPLIDLDICATAGGTAHLRRGFHPAGPEPLVGRRQSAFSTGRRRTVYLCWRRRGWEQELAVDGTVRAIPVAHAGLQPAAHAADAPPPGAGAGAGDRFDEDAHYTRVLAFVRAFTPQFWLHGADRYLPTSVSAHLGECELWFGSAAAAANPPHCGDVLVLARGMVTSESLVRQSVAVGVDGTLRVLGSGEVDSSSAVQDGAHVVHSSGEPILDPEGDATARATFAAAADGSDVDVEANGVARDSRWRLRIADAALPRAHFGCDPSRLDTDAPVYARLRPGTACIAGVEVLSIVFCTFYAYNGPYKLAGGWAGLAGGHEADVEHVTVHVCAATGELHSVWYHAHRARDGRLCSSYGDQVETAADGRPVVYVALNGHGHYPRAGTYSRIFGFANDQCQAGRLWRPSAELVPSNLHDRAKLAATHCEWLLFPGRLGTPYKPYHRCSEQEARSAAPVVSPGGSPHNMAVQDWWGFEECCSRSAINRIFRPDAR